MPPMTLTEKILARHAGRDAVRPDDNIWVDADLLMTHDVCGPGTIGVFKQHFGKEAKVWDRDVEGAARCSPRRRRTLHYGISTTSPPLREARAGRIGAAA